MNKGIGIYIHIPFCKSKCYYCDFNSYSDKGYLVGPYFNALLSEITEKAEMMSDLTIKSIFIGGGTPSFVDAAYIEELLEACSKHYSIDSDAEISIESNPGTLTFSNLKSYKAAGINRLSIGLQAWQDYLLKELGRAHRRQQYIDNIEAAFKAGFRNINTDLIFGLPSQTLEDWQETLESVIAVGSDSGLTHLSCYSLQIEEGTDFGDRFIAGTLKPADDELDRQMYRYTVETLRQKGYEHYEISNFAKKGFECRHNLIYWKAEEYAGFGAGSHSYLNNVRSSNCEEPERYIEAVKSDNLNELSDKQFIDRRESMSEFMILGLRLVEGINAKDFEQRYGVSLYSIYGDALDKLVNKGLLEKASDSACKNSAEYTECFRLTPIGMDLGNKVFVEFLNIS